ncbi:Bidirectional sugar transporter SWEET5, partial [Cucurbita argyrosperma subsp. argyrosperma]
MVYTDTARTIIGIIGNVISFGLFTSPIFTEIPNSLGALSGLIQLILYATYYRTTNWDDDNRSSTRQEVQMSDV